MARVGGMAPEPLSLPESDWKGWLEDRARGQIRHAGDAIAQRCCSIEAP